MSQSDVLNESDSIQQPRFLYASTDLSKLGPLSLYPSDRKQTTTTVNLLIEPWPKVMFLTLSHIPFAITNHMAPLIYKNYQEI
jgi:hypothetical protein